MRLVVEDPTAADGVREYQPERHGYDPETETWDVVIASATGPDIRRSIPRERVVYVETAAEE